MPTTGAVRRGFAGIVTLSAALIAATSTIWSAQNPSLLFSVPYAAPLRTAVDPRGFIYVAGRAASYGSSFVTKLTPSRTVVYTTYFTGTRFTGEPGDCPLVINDLAVDESGAAYITGCTTATDFPLVNAMVSTLPGSRGSGFVAKLSPSGVVVYSTYFDSGGGYDEGTGIAADAAGNAYVVGAGTGSRLPLVNAAHRMGPGFAAKFDASGSRLLYSTYLGASPRALAVDRAGAASIAGSGNIDGFAVRPLQPCRSTAFSGGDAVIIRINPSGSSFDYATCLGGSRSDAATDIAVDASGSTYVVGSTKSLDFPLAHPLDDTTRTGPLWKTDDSGRTWTNVPLDADYVYGLARGGISWYAGTIEGGFTSTDEGAHWQSLGLPLRLGEFAPSVIRLAVAAGLPSTIYLSTSETLLKSTDGGGHWTAVGAGLPFDGAYLRGLAIDASDSPVVYAASQRGFWRSVDGGGSWSASTRGISPTSYIDLLSAAPVSGTLYIGVSGPSSFDHFFMSSTDRGVTWMPLPLRIGKRTVTALIALRGGHGPHQPRSRQPRDEPPDRAPATIYVAAAQVFSDGPFGVLYRSDDNGDSWTSVGAGLPDRGADVLVVAPSDPRILYAASRGAVFVSRDRGNTFEPFPIPSSFGSVLSLAVDPARPQTLWVGTSARSDAFVARIAPGGGSLDYATYLGGAGDDTATQITVDDLGRATVFGVTESDDLPAVAPLQPRRGGRDVFVSELDSGGAVLLFSTWLGAAGDDDVVSAVRAGRSLLFSGVASDLAAMFPGGGASGRGAYLGVLDLATSGGLSGMHPPRH